jgi:hypothetical protein
MQVVSLSWLRLVLLIFRGFLGGGLGEVLGLVVVVVVVLILLLKVDVVVGDALLEIFEGPVVDIGAIVLVTIRYLPR